MAINKHLLLLVFVIGISIIGGIVEAEGRACTQDCPMLDAKYMTCPSTGSLQLNPVCNCCRAPEGECVFYFDNNRQFQCEKRLRPCTFNIEPADYMTCSYAGDILLKPTANCCSAPYGCSFHLNGQVRNCDDFKPFESSSSV